MGEACAEMPWHLGTPYRATIGLRVAPEPRDSGGVFTYETKLGALPHAFHQAIEDTVHTSMLTGLSGAPVTDYRVTGSSVCEVDHRYVDQGFGAGGVGSRGRRPGGGGS
jgi:hypothetical protein